MRVSKALTEWKCKIFALCIPSVRPIIRTEDEAGSALGHKDRLFLVFSSILWAELAALRSQCSLVLYNMDSFNLRHDSLVRKGCLWRAVRVTRPVRWMPQLLGSWVSCSGLQTSRKIQSAGSAVYHCTRLVAGRKLCIATTTKAFNDLLSPLSSHISN